MQIFLRQYNLNLLQIYQIIITRANIFAWVGPIFNFFIAIYPKAEQYVTIFRLIINVWTDSGQQIIVYKFKRNSPILVIVHWAHIDFAGNRVPRAQVLYVFGCKGTIFLSHSDTYLKYFFYGLILFFLVWEFDILFAERAARWSMGRVRTDSNISFAQSTAMTDGSAYRCFMIKTLGPVVMLPANFLAWSNRSMDTISLMIAALLDCGAAIQNAWWLYPWSSGWQRETIRSWGNSLLTISNWA